MSESEGAIEIKPSLKEITFAVDAAKGRRPGTVLLRNATLVNLLSGETCGTDILLAGRLVAALGPGYQAETEFDLAGRYVTPGLIDGHLHLESAMVQPSEYAAEVVPRGVTATGLETAGSQIDLDEIDWLLTHPRVVGVAELMNFPGTIGGDSGELSEALLADKHGKRADGHSPLVRGHADDPGVLGRPQPGCGTAACWSPRTATPTPGSRTPCGSPT